MGRFFDSREECDKLVDQATSPDQSVEEQLLVMGGEAGETFGAMLALRNAAKALDFSFGGDTGNEVHDAHTVSTMREPLAQLHLAIEQLVDGAKEVTWYSEICQCQQCQYQDKQRASKYN